MSKSTFAELLAESKAKIFKPGDMIEGEVFTASGNKIVVDIDGRGLGVIYSKELSADTPKLNKGEKIVATVL
jgi:ribosomal protein S1